MSVRQRVFVMLAPAALLLLACGTRAAEAPANEPNSAPSRVQLEHAEPEAKTQEKPIQPPQVPTPTKPDEKSPRPLDTHSGQPKTNGSRSCGSETCVQRRLACATTALLVQRDHSSKAARFRAETKRPTPGAHKACAAA